MPTDHKRVQDVFLGATEIDDPAGRAVYLMEACGDDLHLKSRVEALLVAHSQPDSLLDAPLVAVPDQDCAPSNFLPDPGHDSALSNGSETRGDDDESLAFLSPPSRPDSLGRIGHYEVLEVLGRGGFGIVFRAFDDVLHRVVAVKVLSPQMAATSPARKRFLREARAAAQIRHENVVQVYEVGEQPLPYIAMEFIPGETLQQRLNRVGPVEVAEVVRIGRQIAEGLAAAHATDLIHRDIKPGNILLEGGHQKVKITDFGLARAADDANLSLSGIIAGTPKYMSPEQALGHKLDHRVDLFSLGSVLYQVASGRPPFRANNAMAVLKRVAEDTPRSIREIIPETPQWLCDIIARLHAKNPDDRYQSAREVADVLAECEAQLKANSKVKDFSLITRTRTRRPGPQKWLVAAAAMLLPVIALAATEFAGVTHLFGRQHAISETNKSGSDPQADAKAGWNGWQAKATTPAIASFEAPFTDTDAQRISALLPAAQVEEVRKALIRRNPGFDGKVEHKIEGGVVTEFKIVTDRVMDIAPIRAFNGLRVLGCSGSESGYNKPNGILADLKPLEGTNLAYLTHVNLDNNTSLDAGLANFKDCKNLVELQLWNTNFTDAGLANFKNCKNLAYLNLGFTPVSDAGLANFKDCKNLTRLVLGETKVGDAGLANFKDCKDLRVLHLWNTKLTDAGLANFKDCKNLTHLNFSLTQVSDAGLANFEDCKNLTSLNVGYSQVSDAGLAHFKGMRLTELWIYETGITDLSVLQGMPLEDIRLTSKNITRGVDTLREMKSLKTIGINWDRAWPPREFWDRYDKGEFK